MQAASSDWSWEHVPSTPRSPMNTRQRPHTTSTSPPGNDFPREQEQPDEPNPDDPPRHSRRCRICLEWVAPTYENVGILGGIRNRRPRRHYISEEGRLINPCLCRGSIKYVHESCLRRWGQENARARYQCGICQYRYQMERLSVAQRLRSPLISLIMTLVILFVTIFVLGFFADPILALWLDPVGTITDTIIPGSVYPVDDNVDSDEADGWLQHFLKGVFSLGLLGFVKAFLAMSPWQWWNLRTSGIVSGGARRAGTGRQRMENINLTLILIGVVTFLYGVWRATRNFTERTLNIASERIMNIQNGEDSDDEDSEAGNN
ncbi:hypothetical protein F5Y10DRAFT_7487 [Nemania abortiva]|nr:hypothetical protein F5Y10DRAFT_7487 [Nemania abortiva]